MLFTPEVRELLLANSRTPGERSGDLAAQIGANEVGVRRLAELAGAPFDAVLHHGAMRPGGAGSVADRDLGGDRHAGLHRTGAAGSGRPGGPDR
ncbi:MAG: hydantoinase B/oxoprolinase family protein [Microthrixaceae bacterium]|nr:hydantoinase B/oxoprolinase family protein [Microthrixaceae bacterium]